MTPERLAEIEKELAAAYNSADHINPDVVEELLAALTGRPEITEAEGNKLPWGSVVCSTDSNGYRTLHVRIGQEGYLYWADTHDDPGETYPWLFGNERVTLWHYPYERTT